MANTTQRTVVYNVVTNTNNSVSNINNLSSAANQASQETTGLFSGMIKGVKDTFKAFIANPIGLTIAAIVGGLKMLYDAFKKTAGGQTMLAKGMGVVKGVVNVLTTAFVSFSKIVQDAINKPGEAWDSFTDTLKNGYEFIKNQVIDRISGNFELMGGNLSLIFGKIKLAWNKLWNDNAGIKKAEEDIKNATKQMEEGALKIINANKEVNDVVDDVVSSFKELGNEIKKAVKEATKLELIESNLNRVKNTIKLSNAELEKQKALYERIADDSTRSLKEREEAARKVIDISNTLALNNETIAKKELDLALKRKKFNKDNSIEAQTEIADLKVAYIKAQEERVQTELEGNQRIQEIRSDTFELALDAEVDFTDKLRQELLKRSADESLSFEERKSAIRGIQSLTETSYKKQIELFNEFSDKKIDANKIAKLSDAEQVTEYLNGLGLSETLTTRFLQDILGERITVNSDIQAANKDLNKKIEIANEESANKEKERIETLKQEELDAIAETIRAHDEKIETINTGLNTTLETSQALIDFNNAQRDLELTKTKNYYNELDNIANKSYNNQLKDLKKQKKDGLITEEEYQSQVNSLKETFEAEQKTRDTDRKTDEEAAKKEAFEKNKKFEKTQVIMKLASAIMGTWAGYAELGPYGTILAAIQTAALAGTAGYQLAAINATEYYASGGKLFGDSHSQASGGIPIGYNAYAEGGEFIVNRASTQVFEPLLNAINDAGNSNGNTNEVNSLIDYNKLASAIQSKKVYVVSNEITDAQADDIAITNKVTF